MKRRICSIASVAVTAVCLVCVIFQFCSKPVDPYANPHNVTIDLILPDTTTSVVCTRDSFSIRVAVILPSLVDSVTLTIGGNDRYSFTTVTDTMVFRYAFQDTGLIQINATAFCEQGVIKESQKSLRVYAGISKWDEMIWDQDIWE